MMATVTFTQALEDQNLLGHTLQGESWHPWRSVLKSIKGEPLSLDELESYRKLTGRYQPPASFVTEALFLIGRRGGKDQAIATFAVYLSALCDWSDKLAPGETGVCLIISPDLKQSRETMRRCLGILESSPLLKDFIANSTLDTVELKNGIVIEARAASFRRIRGITAIAILANEAAFWMSDDSSANADAEILNAARPMLATTGGPLLIFTSPYAKRGEVYEIYSKYFGPNGPEDVLVFQATTRDMNSTIPQSVIDKALERDPELAAAEYLAQFRSDISNFIDREVVERLIEKERYERPYEQGIRYFAFTDPSGGSSDSFTLAIAHQNKKGVAVLDLVRERAAPFSPEAVVEDFARTLKNYGLRRVVGDAYAGMWPREQFAKYGIEYIVSDKNKSSIYREMLPVLNSGKATLLDVPRMIHQLCALERRTGRSGKDSIDHPQGAKDDLCNAAAGALLLAAEKRTSPAIITTTYQMA
jgi:hypothetical protein